MDSVFSAGKYVTWGVVSISATNLLIIVLMVVVFVLALVVPFPHGHQDPPGPDPRRRPARGRAAMTAVSPPSSERTWTAALKERMSRTLPADQVLPDRQPAYVASWIYVFGVLTLAGLLVVVGSGHRALRRRVGLVAHLGARALRELRAPVERGALLRLHGDPSLGQVLDGRLARSPGPDLGHRAWSRS